MRKIVYFGLVALSLFLVACNVKGPIGKESEVVIDGEINILPDGTKYIVHPNKLLPGGPAKDGIPSIDNPKFVSAEKANKWLRDDELVLGISRNGVTRAYPLQILVWHEIVNDVLGEDNVVVTYCPLCGTGIAFDRTIEGEAVEFGVSGLLLNSDLVMFDRKTDTYWTQVGGKAIVGELTGMKLKQLALDTIEWGKWKEKYPNTEVLSRDTGSKRSYGKKNPYGDYDTNERIMFPVSNLDDRLHPKENVYGVEVDGNYKAYTLKDLEREKSIKDRIGEVNIEISIDNGIVSVVNLDTNEKIIPTRSFWFGWAAFYPDTELYNILD